MTDSWGQKYREVVKEYGPPVDRPSLFLFGRDEYVKSSSHGNEDVKSSFIHEYEEPRRSIFPSHPHSPHLSPPPAPPLPPGWAQKSSRQPDDHHRVPLVVQIEPTPTKTFHSSPLISNALSPQYQYFTKSHEKFEEFDNYRDWIKKKRVTEVETEKKFGWKELKGKENDVGGQDKENVSYWKRKCSTNPQKDRRKDNLQDKVDDPHQNLMQELKRRFETKEAPQKVYSTTNVQTDSEPERFANMDTGSNSKRITSNNIAAQKNRSKSPKFLHERSKLLPVVSAVNNTGKNSSGTLRDIEKLLQTDTIVNPIIENFIRKNFTNYELTDLQESEVPMKHYWERVFKVSDGKKDATIKLENLLTIEPNQRLAPIFQTGLSSEHQRKNSVISNLSSGSNEEFDMELLMMIHQKIANNQCLDWPELFLLKNSHCRHVDPREKMVKKLRQNPYAEQAAKEVEKNLLESYKSYQALLEKVRPKEELYTELAYLIMKAEAYWYAGKIDSGSHHRKTNYQQALKYYGDLLAKSQKFLQPDNRSVLTIIEKISQIVLEGGFSDPKTLDLCHKAVYQAEKELGAKSDIKKERKIIKIKNNLMQFKNSL